MTAPEPRSPIRDGVAVDFTIRVAAGEEPMIKLAAVALAIDL